MYLKHLFALVTNKTLFDSVNRVFVLNTNQWC